MLEFKGSDEEVELISSILPDMRLSIYINSFHNSPTVWVNVIQITFGNST